ncbi:MAG: hypothetical protein K2X27_02905, partial [Candidatus Obscuribacterales bacterium]|nr:hypothetical protein [Candidatus Obscuribacterales bacterium]
QAIEFFLSLPDMERKSHGPAARTMSLDSMRALLKRLGNPELGRKTAHLTGSKGKGSTSTFLTALLAKTAKTSLYTSPHLHSYRERICFDLKPVSEADFARGAAALKESVLAEHESELGPISTFGAMTSLFFWLSREQNVDWQVVEVGLGGRYDGTNVFDTKELVIITAISLEHTSLLGKSTLEIAENKAGIIRPGATVVLAPQHDREIAPLIQSICKKEGARFLDFASEYSIEASEFSRSSQSFMLRRNNAAARKFSIQMQGLHQLNNAATAIAAIDLLFEDSFSEKDAAEALASASLPGRLELLQESPLLVVDGAHNGESAEALVAALKRHYPGKNLHFLLAVNSDKNIAQILDAILPASSRLIASRSQSDKAMDPELIASEASKRGKSCDVYSTSKEALQKALESAAPDDLICATGSLYLVAEIREQVLGNSLKQFEHN